MTKISGLALEKKDLLEVIREIQMRAAFEKLAKAEADRERGAAKDVSKEGASHSKKAA